VRAPQAPREPRREAPHAAPAPKPPAETPAPERPALEGSSSLRDALAAITAGKNQATEPKKAVHKPDAHAHAHTTPPLGGSDLKEALDKVAKKAPSPASLPKEELRAMLSVDPELEGSHHEHKKHHEPRG
jgi:hypothetical protein